MKLVRVLVYEGDEEWVERCLRNRGVAGERTMSRGTIREIVCVSDTGTVAHSLYLQGKNVGGQP